MLISFLAGRMLGPSTAYINHDVATAICGFIYGDINGGDNVRNIYKYWYFDSVNICNDRLSHNIEDIQQNQESLIF